MMYTENFQTSGSVDELLSRFPVLTKMNRAILSLIIDPENVVTLPTGSKVFSELETCDNYFFVLEGRIRVYRVTESGREVVLYRVAAGETCILTTACLASGEPYPADAVTEAPLKIITISKAVFHDAVGASSEFREFVFSNCGRRIASLLTRF